MSQKTQTSITVEYQKIIQLVANLVEDCDSLDVMVTKLEALTDELMCTVNCQWEGEGATAFGYKCLELKEQITSNRNAIKQAAQTIASIANDYKKAELASIGLIEANVTITISNDGTVSYSSGGSGASGSSGGGTW